MPKGWLQWIEAVLGIVNDLESAGVIQVKEIPKIDAVAAILTKRLGPVIAPQPSPPTVSS